METYSTYGHSSVHTGYERRPLSKNGSIRNLHMHCISEPQTFEAMMFIPIFEHQEMEDQMVVIPTSTGLSCFHC